MSHVHCCDDPDGQAAALAADLRQALEVIDLQQMAAEGDLGAALDIRLRPSVMRTWRKNIDADLDDWK